MSQQVPNHVFISYSRPDEKVMKQVAERLRGHGIQVWVDNENLIPGTPIWEREVEKAIKIASGVVVLLSPEAKDSTWVLREITLAENNKKFIVPILIRGDSHSSMPFRLVNHQYIDMRSNQKAGLDDLVDALSNVLGHTIFEKATKASQASSSAPKTPEKAVQDMKLNAILEEIDRKAAERAARERADANRSAPRYTTAEPPKVVVPTAPKRSRTGWFLLAVVLFFTAPMIGVAMGDQTGAISIFIGGLLFIITLIIGSKVQ